MKTIKELYTSKYSKDVIRNYNVVGSLTINDSVVSGFSTGNYVTLAEQFNAYTASANSWEVVFKFTHSVTSAVQALFAQGADMESKFYIKAENLLAFQASNNGTSYNVVELLGTTELTDGTTYWGKVEFTGSAYKLYLSTDGITYNLEATSTTSTKISDRTSNWAIGFNLSSSSKYYYPFSGSIDFKESYIKINGSIWWSDDRKTSVCKSIIQDAIVAVDPDKEYYYGIVGSPTRSNNIISGFSTSNYLKVPYTFNSAIGSQTWEIVGKFKLTTARINPIYGGEAGTYLLDIAVNASNKFHLSLSSNGSSYNIANAKTGSHTVAINTNYWVKLEFTGSAYILSYSLDGVDFIQDIEITSSTVLESTTDLLCLGFRASQYLAGSIDMSGCYIKINNKIYWQQPKTRKIKLCKFAK